MFSSEIRPRRTWWKLDVCFSTIMDVSSGLGDQCIFSSTVQHNVSRKVRYSNTISFVVDGCQVVANSNLHLSLERQPAYSTEITIREAWTTEDLRGEYWSRRNHGNCLLKYGSDVCPGDGIGNNRQHFGILERDSMEAATWTKGGERATCDAQISVRCNKSEARQITPEVRQRSSCSHVERSDSTIGSNVKQGIKIRWSELVIASLNCEGLKTNILSDLLTYLSHDHEDNIILCLQETWRYELSTDFVRGFRHKYNFVHESAMNPSVARQKSRPYGGCRGKIAILFF